MSQYGPIDDGPELECTNGFELHNFNFIGNKITFECRAPKVHISPFLTLSELLALGVQEHLEGLSGDKLSGDSYMQLFALLELWLGWHKEENDEDCA